MAIRDSLTPPLNIRPIAESGGVNLSHDMLRKPIHHSKRTAADSHDNRAFAEMDLELRAIPEGSQVTFIANLKPLDLPSRCDLPFTNRA